MPDDSDSDRTWSPTSLYYQNGRRQGDTPEDIVYEKVPRFRVLVMGRRNAGKTTLLQRMTQSSDGQVLVSDSDGNPVDSSILEPSVERGQSHINYEITYPSNPGFVFHDSRGMEAGSDEEVEKLIEFMAQRAKKPHLKDRLHVIWYCLPVDNDRPLSKAEMQFFEQGTGDVPVIAIFTKFEWRITKAFAQLREQGVGFRAAKDQARDKALDDFDLILQARKEITKHPPAGIVFLQEMDKPDADCSILTQRTWETIQNEVIQQLFVIVQKNRAEVSMSVAIIYAASLAKEKHMYVTKDEHHLDQWTGLLLSLFPYWNNFFHMEKHWEIHWDWTHGWIPFLKLTESDQSIVRAFSREVVSWIEPGYEPELQLFNVFIDVLMIAEAVFWQPDFRTTPWHNIIPVSKAYRKSQSRLIVQVLAKEIYNSEIRTQFHVKKDRLKRMALKWVPQLLEKGAFRPGCLPSSPKA